MSEAGKRRRYGTGGLIIRRGSYYGKIRVGDKQVMRKLGPVRTPGRPDGLKRSDAEAKLRELMALSSYHTVEERLTFRDTALLYIDHVENVRGRKKTTVHDYRLMLDKHLGPHFGNRALADITTREVGAYLPMKVRAGLSPKTLSNHMVFAHGVFAFAVKQGLTASNPVAHVDRPKAAGANPNLRFLTMSEFGALMEAVPADALGGIERIIYMAAAMTGLRQGELVALRWADVDWNAGVVRVRRNYTRSQWGTPKSRRSSRAVPLADGLLVALRRHHAETVFDGDEDLVFAHPQTGGPYDASKLRKRFYAAMRSAGLGEKVGQRNGVTFHSLRHTYATHMAAVGTPMRKLQEYMGHRSIQTTEIYADYMPGDEHGRSLTNEAFDAVTKRLPN